MATPRRKKQTRAQRKKAKKEADRKRWANLTPEDREAYNASRRVGNISPERTAQRNARNAERRATDPAAKARSINDKGMQRAKADGLPYEKVRPLEIYERDKGVCQLCSKPVGILEFSLDHVIPHGKGGNWVEPNLQTAHYQCNRRKYVHDAMLPWNETNA